MARLALLGLLAAVGATRAQYNLAKTYAGSSFFDDWAFFGQADILTNGDVQYVTASDKQGLAYVNGAGNAVIKVDNTTNVAWPNKRNSVRINTTDAFSIGSVFLFDAVHLPYGCTVWPSFWTAGTNWPDAEGMTLVLGRVSPVALPVLASEGCVQIGLEWNCIGILRCFLSFEHDSKPSYIARMTLCAKYTSADATIQRTKTKLDDPGSLLVHLDRTDAQLASPELAWIEVYELSEDGEHVPDGGVIDDSEQVPRALEAVADVNQQFREGAQARRATGKVGMDGELAADFSVLAQTRVLVVEAKERSLAVWRRADRREVDDLLDHVGSDVINRRFVMRPRTDILVEHVKQCPRCRGQRRMTYLTTGFVVRDPRGGTGSQHRVREGGPDLLLEGDLLLRLTVRCASLVLLELAREVDFDDYHDERGLRANRVEEK